MTELADLSSKQIVEPDGEPQRLDITAHEVLKSIYQDPNQPIGLRCRAAIKAIEVETPKVMAVGVASIGGQHSFAEALDRCLERSKQSTVPLLNGPKTIEHAELVSAEELKKPFQGNYRRFTSPR
jgi:hypothetical protein